MSCLNGENHPKAALTWEQVVKIRHEYVPGKVTYGQLAHKYYVSKTTISRIINGITWLPENQPSAATHKEED